MRGKITILLFILGNALGFGQIDSTRVPFISYWAKGDSYDFKMTKIKQEWREGVLTKNDSSSYIVNFEVIDSTEEQYKIKWSHKTNLSQFDIPPDLLKEFSKYQLTELIYTTNEFGEFIGIENWEEIAAMMTSMFNDLFDFMADEGTYTREELSSKFRPIIQLYESREGIEQLLYKELGVFHFPFGLEFPVNEIVQYEEEMPSLLGGKPIRGDARLYIESVDFEYDHCVLIQEMNLNPDDTKKMMNKLFRQLGLKDKEMKEALKSAEFDIRDLNRFEYYFYPGIPIHIKTVRETVINMANENGKRVDIIEIEWID